MKFTQRFAAVLSVIMACVVLGGLLLLTAENARTQTYPVPQPKLNYEIPVNPRLSDKVYPYNPETGFGAFAWQTFVALNWPADANGNPLENNKIGQSPEQPRVWEFYKGADQIFLPNGETPELVSPVMRSPYNNGQNKINIQSLRLRLTEDAGDIDQPKLSADPGVLIDQSGNYILNQIMINPIEVDEIVHNQWYSANNLAKFNNTDNLFALVCSDKIPDGNYPDGSRPDKFPCKKNEKVGAIEIKVAWKVLEEPVTEEMKGKYYTTKRKFMVKDINGKPKEVKVPVGLVGFHIIQKTSQQGWIFATFEQVNNVPDPSEQNPTGTYTLYNPDCTGQYCDPNISFGREPYLWKDEFPHAVTKIEGQTNLQPQIPSQITRLVPITGVAHSLNKQWQKALGEISNASVWQNYQLIGTQWLTSPSVNPDQLKPLDIEPRQGNQPSKLVNVTLEPYVQKSPPRGTSCIACHKNAMLPRQDGVPTVFADLDFLMNNAQFPSGDTTIKPGSLAP